MTSDPQQPVVKPAVVPPRACTTAAAVRKHAVEPAMELISLERRERELLAELTAVSEQRETVLREIAGFTSTTAERLAFAEVEGSYEAVPPVVSEAPSMRRVAQIVNTSIDALADVNRRREHAGARESLHALFESFGADLFEQACLYHVGKERTLALRGEFARWRKP